MFHDVSTDIGFEGPVLHSFQSLKVLVALQTASPVSCFNEEEIIHTIHAICLCHAEAEVPR